MKKINTFLKNKFPRVFAFFSSLRLLFELFLRGRQVKRFQIVRLCVIKAFTFLIGAAGIYISKPMLDEALVKGNWWLFLRLALLGGLIFILGLVLENFSAVLLERIKNEFSLFIHQRVAGKFYRMDIRKIKNQSSGENGFLVGYDADIIVQFALDELPGLISFPKAAVFFVLAFYFSWQLSLIALLAMPLYFVQGVFFGARRRLRKENIFYAQAKFASYVQESFFNIKLIKIFGREAQAISRYVDLLRERIKAQFDYFIINTGNAFAEKLLSSLALAVFLLIGGYLIIKGKITLGTFGIVSVYLTLMFAQSGIFCNTLQQAFEDFDSLGRLSGFISSPEENNKPKQMTTVEIHEGKIEFDNVWFGYGSDKMVLKGASLICEPGRWTGITGQSGCGKTTLVNMIVKLFGPAKGKIFLDGVILDEIETSFLRENISLATQEPLLLNDTIFNNISFGSDCADIEKVRRAAEFACIDEHILSLPLGYETRIGEAGFFLSEGQKQRISLARAFIREPRILLLDEATSSIDIETEGRILSNIKNNFSRLTVVLISHRPQSLSFSDRIYAMQDGVLKSG
ncbi:MAG: ABC transporter ATP-binding protein [Candidatus Omnitrophica bacterium]|nr:ABC transporter ATP-binding protein [Candidatus Omnitrophota bacterium]